VVAAGTTGEEGGRAGEAGGVAAEVSERRDARDDDGARSRVDSAAQVDGTNGVQAVMSAQCSHHVLPHTAQLTLQRIRLTRC